MYVYIYIYNIGIHISIYLSIYLSLSIYIYTHIYIHSMSFDCRTSMGLHARTANLRTKLSETNQYKLMNGTN